MNTSPVHCNSFSFVRTYSTVRRDTEIFPTPCLFTVTFNRPHDDLLNTMNSNVGDEDGSEEEDDDEAP